MKRTLLTAILLLGLPAVGGPKTIEILDGFESGLGRWKASGSGISLVTEGCRGSGKCVLIERINSRDMSVITRQFTPPSPGRMTLTAYVKASNVSVGEKYYERGKFIVALVEDGRECCWRDNDFDGTLTSWTRRKIVVNDVTPSTPLILRIGLQYAKGQVFVDDVKVEFEPYANS
jgi:hypothetical protein